jgi:DNA polymerase-3 subunit beta
MGGVLLQARSPHDQRAVRTMDGARHVDHAEITKLPVALVKGTCKRDADDLPITVRTAHNGVPVVDLDGCTMPVTRNPMEDYPSLPDTAPTLAEVNREPSSATRTVSWSRLARTPCCPCSPAVAPLPAVQAHAVNNACALVPGRIVAAMVKRFTGDRVRIGFDDVANSSTVSFSCGDVTVSTRTLDTRFPRPAPCGPTASRC